MVYTYLPIDSRYEGTLHSHAHSEHTIKISRQKEGLNYRRRQQENRVAVAFPKGSARGIDEFNEPTETFNEQD